MGKTFTSLDSPIATRGEFQEACVSLLDPLLPYFTPGGTRVRLGYTGTRYDEVGAQIQGFARPLWGLAPLLAGGYDYDASRFVEGLRNSTNPEQPEYWGLNRDSEQRAILRSPARG